MSTPPPHDPPQWGSGQNPPENQNSPSEPAPANGPPTGGWGTASDQDGSDNQVTYNADKFDDDSNRGAGTAQEPDATRYEQSPGYPAAPPTSGYESAPQTGGYGVPPQTGGYDSQPQTGGYDSQPQTGGYDAGAQTGGYQTGGYDAQTGGYDAQSGGYDAQSGTYPAVGGGQPEQAAWGDTTTKSKSKKPLLIGAGVLVVVAALVVGFLVFTGFDGIRNSKGEIKNASAFLTETKSAWESELPEDGIEVSSKAACYYVINGRDEITNEVACGPARRASTGEGEVWDLYHFNVSGSGDNQTASEPGSLKTSQKAPTGDDRFVTVDGDEPADDGLSIKEPPLPKADENGVWTSEQFVVEDSGKASEAELVDDPRLVAPGAEVIVDAITEYSQATIDGELMQSAEGQKFVILDLTGSSGPVEESASNTIGFDLDGESVDSGLDPASMGTVQVLVSVPADGDSSLVLDTEGHTQTLNLADGERAEDATTAQYYTDNPAPSATVGQNLEYPAAASSAGDQFSVSVGLTDATLEPYNSVDGWAPEGQVWLTINFTHSATTATPGSQYTQYGLDCMGSTIDGGTMEFCQSLAGGIGQFVAAVPAGTTSIAINIVFTLTATGSGLPDTTASYGPSAVAVTF